MFLHLSVILFIGGRWSAYLDRPPTHYTLGRPPNTYLGRPQTPPPTHTHTHTREYGRVVRIQLGCVLVIKAVLRIDRSAHMAVVVGEGGVVMSDPGGAGAGDGYV